MWKGAPNNHICAVKQILFCCRACSFPTLWLMPTVLLQCTTNCTWRIMANVPSHAGSPKERTACVSLIVSRCAWAWPFAVRNGLCALASHEPPQDDTRFPMLWRAMAFGGEADAVISPTGWPRDSGFSSWHLLVQARAVENQVSCAR